ncbi:POK18 protein, partial [Podargus strigoides]|nr:POK18 protein [Podargus strigoides]
TKAVIRHCLAVFAVLGIPQVIKTDNGSGYTSQAFGTFLRNWGIRHLTGIPGNSQGQSIVEHAHHS